MQGSIHTPGNKERWAHYDRFRTPFSRLGEKLSPSPWQADFLKRLRAKTHTESWHFRSADHGALALCYIDGKGQVATWFVGRSIAFDDVLIDKAYMHHPSNARRILKEIERDEASREEAQKRDALYDAECIAGDRWNHDAIERRHFVQPGVN